MSTPEVNDTEIEVFEDITDVPEADTQTEEEL